ncbi:long-chain-fatty-acid--CoA ligase [Streptomyces sp. NPDC051018]|uniref:long-chain-fatty-acid--CoA ligase n=1 Tax=Streptomyces sp. NPDC051018 TaxID=3365639 RepID=UPI0037B61A06
MTRLAGALRALGVDDGDRVAVLARNSDRYHESVLATWWAGGVVVPLNTRWSAAEVAFALGDAEPDVLVVDDALLPLLGAGEAVPGGVTVVHAGDGAAPPGTLDYEELVEGHEPVADAVRRGQDIAGIFYTGGTTGRPKGVMLSHANLVISTLGIQATVRGIHPGGRLLLFNPLFHAGGFGCWNYQNTFGGTQVILPGFEPLEALRAIERHRVTLMWIVPTMIQALLDHPERGKYDLSSIRHIQYGASPISPTLLRRALEAFPGSRFAQGYGMTELSPAATMLTPEDHEDESRLDSVGRPVPFTELKVVDPDDAEVPRGQVGEIICRGGQVMLGYWRRPEEAAAALRGGWMHTGDAGYLDKDGYVHVVDRIKDMIVSGGENVYSAEVENALVQHPAVGSCAVIGVPDDTYGERVHAVVVLTPGHTVTAEELRAHCKTLIAGYKSPRSAEFVASLPLSGAGKILKRELRAPHWSGRGRSVH